MNEHGDVLAYSINMPLSVEDGARLFLADDSPMYGFDKKIFPGRALQEEDWSVMFVRPEEGESVHTTIARAGKDKGEGGLEFAVQRLKDTDTHTATSLGGNFLRKIKDELAPVVVVRQGKTYVFPQDKPFQFPGATLSGDLLHMMFDSKHNALIVLAHADKDFPKISKDRQLLNRKPEEEASREIPTKVTSMPEALDESMGSIRMAPVIEQSARIQTEKQKIIDIPRIMRQHVPAVRGMRYQLNWTGSETTGRVLLPYYSQSNGYSQPQERDYGSFLSADTPTSAQSMLFAAAQSKAFFSKDLFSARRVYEQAIDAPPLVIALFNGVHSTVKEPGGWWGFGKVMAPALQLNNPPDAKIWLDSPNTQAVLFIRGAYNHLRPSNHMGMRTDKDGYFGISHRVSEWHFLEFNDISVAQGVFDHLQSLGGGLKESLMQLVVGIYSEKYQSNFVDQYQTFFADCTT